MFFKIFLWDILYSFFHPTNWFIPSFMSHHIIIGVLFLNRNIFYFCLSFIIDIWFMNRLIFIMDLRLWSTMVMYCSYLGPHMTMVHYWCMINSMVHYWCMTNSIMMINWYMSYWHMTYSITSDWDMCYWMMVSLATTTYFSIMSFGFLFMMTTTFLTWHYLIYFIFYI